MAIRPYMVPVVILLCLLIYSCSEAPERIAQIPDLKASATPAFGDAPLTVQFEASGRVVSGVGSATYEWDFNDGQKSDELAPEHTFKFVGTYVVEVKATDTTGTEYADWVVVIVN
jgi:cytochrome c